MLAIRLQRTGRKGHAQYRVIVQDSHRSPTSGRVVAYLGSYNPHTKTTMLKKEQAQTFLNNGAQPSDSVIALLKAEGVKLPKWAVPSKPVERKTRNPEKLRKNSPAQTSETEAPVDQPAKPAEDATVAEEKPAEETAAETKPEEQTTPEAVVSGAEEAAPETEAPKAEPRSEAETPAASEETSAEKPAEEKAE